MQAIQAVKQNGETTIHLTQLPKPQASPGSVLVKVYASTIQPSDLMNARGNFPATTFPRVPGRDYAGVIEEGPPSLVGREVYGTSGPGLSFTSDGAHAEYCVVKEDALAMKPKSLSFKQAAAVGTSYTTASLVLERIRARSGDVVLILGSTGSVGSAAAALAKATGCHVLTASRRDGTYVNIAKDPTLSAAKELTSGKGPDLVVDTVGDAKLIRAALDIMNAGGRLGFISAPRSGSTEMAVDILSLYRRNISLVGTNSLTVVASKMAQKMQEMSALFDSGKLEAPVTDRIKLISLAEAADVYTGKLEIIHPLIDMQGT